MVKIFELDRKNIPNQVQKIVRGLKKTSGADDRAKAGLALAILALVSAQPDDSVAQQLLNLMRDLKL